MLSETSICNMALSHLGVGDAITSLGENSQEANSCRAFFEVARDATLRDFSWPFATKTADLALIEEDPNDEWSYSYAYPADCLQFKRVLSGSRNDTRQSREPYRIVKNADDYVVYSDVEDAACEYVFRNEDTQHYPPDFAIALSFRLAAYVAPRLTAGDPFKMGERSMQLYQFELSKARANGANEEQAEEPPQSEFILERET